MTLTTPRPGTGQCGFCNRHVKLTKSGHLRVHGYSNVVGKPCCHGSGLLPLQVSSETLQFRITEIDARLRTNPTSTSLTTIRHDLAKRLAEWKETPLPS